MLLPQQFDVVAKVIAAAAAMSFDSNYVDVFFVYLLIWAGGATAFASCEKKKSPRIGAFLARRSKALLTKISVDKGRVSI